MVDLMVARFEDRESAVFSFLGSVIVRPGDIRYFACPCTVAGIARQTWAVFEYVRGINVSAVTFLYQFASGRTIVNPSVFCESTDLHLPTFRSNPSRHVVGGRTTLFRLTRFGSSQQHS